MGEQEWLAERFEEQRTHLRAVAYRMLGSLSEADDAVQEAWLRLSRTDAGGIENLAGWLTTVVARVSLNMLRSRRARGEEPLGGAGEVHGARAVAGQALAYTRFGAFTRPALVNGAVGAVAILEGEPFAVGAFTVRGGKIVEIDILADPERLSRLDLTI